MDYRVLSDDELVRECAEHSCPEIWEEFLRRFQPTIARAALRTCHEWSESSPDVVEDMVQNTLHKLCADNCSLLKTFQPRHPGSFSGFLRTITANVVRDHMRAKHAVKRDVENTVELNEEIHQLRQDSGSASSAERKILLDEINGLLLRRGSGPVEKRERAIFWLHYRYGLTAKEIASIPSIKLTEKGVESVIHRMMAYVKKSLITQEVKKD